MAVAVAYPETQQGKRKTSLIFKEVGINAGYVSQARFVLRHCLEKAEASETDRLIKRHINTTRYLLLDMRDRKGWKALGYESFKDYGEKELGYQENYIHKLVNAAEISLQIGFNSDCTIVQPPESHLRPLKAVPEDERKAIWEEATRKAMEEGEKLTAKRVDEAVEEWKRRSAFDGF
ncbi:MAG: hypothetical protein WAT67_01425 [Candidatus Contendobacter sp.]